MDDIQKNENIDREIMAAISKIRRERWACSAQMVADYLRVNKQWVFNRCTALRARGLVDWEGEVYGSLHCVDEVVQPARDDAGEVAGLAESNGVVAFAPPSPATRQDIAAPLTGEVAAVDAQQDIRLVTDADLAAAGFVVLDDEAVALLPGTQRSKYYGRKGAAKAGVIRAREKALAAAE
jgi:hypothetical protein